MKTFRRIRSGVTSRSTPRIDAALGRARRGVRRLRRVGLRWTILRVRSADRLAELLVDAAADERVAREASRRALAYSTPTAADLVGAYIDGHVLNGRGDSRYDAEFEWLSFPTRAVITRDTARVPKEVRPRLRNGKFDVSFDTDFLAIIEGCRQGRSSWITDPLIEAYRELDELGLVSTVAVRHEGELAAGGWGLSIGGCMCGMSMFHRVSKAGGVAFGALVADLLEHDRLTMIDCVVQTPHAQRFGAVEIPAADFRRRVVGGISRYSS